MKSENKLKLLYIITGLSTGGAEMMLYKLLSKIDRLRFEPVVISLMDRGKFGDRIEDLGIPVYTIGMKQGIPQVSAIFRLINIVHRLKPNLIQGWMYHGNLAAYLASLLSLQKVPVFWSIHHSINSLSSEKSMTIGIIKISAKISRFIHQLIFVSQNSKEQHEVIGYSSTDSCVIPNGFDTSLFKPSEISKIQLRQELGLDKDTFLIGLIGRYHPMKDHANFIKAATLLHQKNPHVHFVLAGSNTDVKNKELYDLIFEANLVNNFHLLGELNDMSCITPGLDIVSLSSAYGEAFPLVIGEAMSCKIPCVITDVGDSAWIVGNTGRVVASKDSEALANAWQELIALSKEEREVLGRLARDRIDELFSLSSVVRDYEILYEKSVFR